MDIAGRGKWVDVTQNLTTGAVTVGSPVTRRSPWYNQTDFNITHSYKLTESKTLGFSATITNVLNERSVTSVAGNITSGFNANFIAPGGNSLLSGIPFYTSAFHAYDVQSLLNTAGSSISCASQQNPNGVCGPATINAGYGQPNRYQGGRNIRLGLRFTF